MDIKERILSFLTEILEFEFSYKVQLYIREKIEADPDPFESEQSINGGPVKGAGVIASMANIESWSERNETLIIGDLLVDPVKSSEAVSFFPLDSVSIVYIYSLLEAYGNDIVEHLGSNPSTNRFKAWHSGVHADADLDDPAKVQSMKKSFCHSFGFKTESVTDTFIESLVRLKLERNKIVHQLEHSLNFSACFQHVVFIACCIYFLASNDHGELKLFPWTDFEGKFE